jgi:hypothetical protein
MANTIQIKGLSAAIERELSVYHRNVIDAVDAAADEAVKDLVSQTKANAPVGARGDFKRSIAGKRLKKDDRGSTYVWYVKAPNHRLTHLLVHGHATKDGGRTKGDPFLQNALDSVLPEYQRKVEEAIKNG